jgi:hypothetical protein
MKLTTKINLIRKFKLNPEQIQFLDSLNLNFDMEDDGIDTILNTLNDKIEELSDLENEYNCLNLAYIISIIENTELKIRINVDNNPSIDFDETIDNFDDFENEDFLDEFTDEVEGFSAKEQRKLQKEAVIKYKKIDKDMIVLELKKYVLEKYPPIINGFDRTFYKNAKIAYWHREHMFNLWEIPIKVYEKIKNAEHEVEEILKEDVKKNADKKYPIWFENYKVWLKKNGLKKSTKANVKDFFKSIKVKPSETIIERIKEDYTRQ